MEESLMHSAELKGVRLFQVYLSDLIQGGKVFQSSCLVPQSQNALAILDHLLESDPNVLLLLTRSLQKCLVHASGISESSDDQTLNSDILDQVLTTVHWFCIYGPKTRQVGLELFKQQFKKVIL